MRAYLMPLFMKLTLVLFTSLLVFSFASVRGENVFGDNISEIEFNGRKKVVTDGLLDDFSDIQSDSVCLQTIFGSFQVEFVGGLDSATSIEFIIRNSTVLQSLGLASVTPKDVLNYVRSYAYFEAFDSEGNNSSDQISVHYDLEFDLLDPVDGTAGDDFVGLLGAFKVSDAQGSTFIDEEGVASLDSDGVSSQEPIFLGAFSGGMSSGSDGVFSNTVEETFGSTIPLDTQLEIFVETFAQVFASQIPSGEQVFWGVDSSNTLRITIEAANPSTRFRRVQLSETVQPDGIINGKGQNFIKRRPSNRQTKRATVGKKKRFRWVVENNGPVINLLNGRRAILAKGPRNSSRLKFRYRNRGANVTGAVRTGRFVLPIKLPGQGELIVVEAKTKRKKKFGKRRRESFNLDARTGAGTKDVCRLQLTTN